MSHGRPARTCVGCREAVAKSDLLRLVCGVSGDLISVIPDEFGGAPGRGAYVHPRLACLDLAQRRKAFTRAFRSDGPLDTSTLRAWLQAHEGRTGPPHIKTVDDGKQGSGS